MALTDIVSTATIHTELGGTLSAGQQAVLDTIRLRMETLVRNYVRWPITEATYTDVYLPAWGHYGYRLQLPHPFVTAVASVYEDPNSRGGQQTGDFDAATLLVAGTDYWIDYDQSEYSREGILFRCNREWPCYPRSVKTTYTAGLDATALANEFLYITDAIINETISSFQFRMARQGTNDVSGDIKREQLEDYEIEYQSNSSSSGNKSGGKSGRSGLSTNTEAALDPIVFYGMML